jgi:hypothetical protein
MVSPILNPESSNICYDFFSTGKLRRKYFEPVTRLFYFSTDETEKNSLKKFVKQIGENM